MSHIAAVYGIVMHCDFHLLLLCSSHPKKKQISDHITTTLQQHSLSQVAGQLLLHLDAKYVHFGEGMMFLW